MSTSREPIGTYVHRDGLWWYEAPLPPRNHICVPHSTGLMGHFTYVERCACGAIQLNRTGWAEKNSRRDQPWNWGEMEEEPRPAIVQFVMDNPLMSLGAVIAFIVLLVGWAL